MPSHPAGFFRLIPCRALVPFWLSLGLFLCSTTLSLRADEGQQNLPRQRLLLLSQGPDGHPAATHEYVAGVRILAEILQRVSNLDVEVSQADGAWSDGPDKLRQASGAFLFLSQGAKWIHEEPRRLEAFAQLAARGGGLSVLHWGMGTREPQHIDGFVKLFGGCHGGPDRKYKIADTQVLFPDLLHPIAAGLKPFQIHEEFYYRLKFLEGTSRWTPVVQAEIEGGLETVGWAWERGDGGRSFGYSGGHFHRNWERPEYRRLVAQGILWTLKLPIPEQGLNVDVDPQLLQLP